MELVIFAFVVLGIFLVPFVLSKLVSILKKSFEKSLPHTMTDEEQLVVEQIRGIAIGLLLVGLLIVVFATLNDLGSAKLWFILYGIVILICSVAVWSRKVWSIWLIGIAIIGGVGWLILENSLNGKETENLWIIWGLVLMLFSMIRGLLHLFPKMKALNSLEGRNIAK